MSNHELSGLLSVGRRDVSLAKLGIVVSILLLGLRLLASQVYLLVIPLAAGAGSLLYLWTHRRKDSRAYSWTAFKSELASPTLRPTVAGYLPSVVVLGLAGLVLAIHQAGLRTDMIYLLTGGIGVVIFVQILFVDDEYISPGLVLFQILAAAVVIRLSALYVTPGYVGVDVWTHVPIWVESIAQEGSLSPLADSKYIMAPFFHVIGAIGTLVLGGARHGVYLTLGLLVPLSALFVYATGILFLPARWALLATAFYAFSDQFIRWGMHIIPTSLGLVFFLAAVYAITRIYYADAEPWAVGLLLASSLAVVFTHQVSTAVLLVLLGFATFVALVTAVTGSASGPRSGIRNLFAIGFVFATTLVTTAVSWTNTPFGNGETFLTRELEVISTIVTERAGFLNLVSQSPEAGEVIKVGGEGGTALSALIPYIELFGFALLLLSTVVGGLYLLRWEGPADIAYTHLLTGAGLFVIVFGLSLFGIRALLPGRWIAFLYVSMALLGSVGLYHVSENGSRRVVVAVLVLVALGYPTTMVVAEKATLDNPAFDDQHKRFAFTQGEIAAVETIREIKPPTTTETLGTDHPYVEIFRNYGDYGERASILEIGPTGPGPTDMTVYRDYQTTGPVTFRQGTDVSPALQPETVAQTVCPPDWDNAYANDEVMLCTPASTSPEGSP